MGGYPGWFVAPWSCLEHLWFARLVLGSWCSAQLLSRVVLGGGLLQSGRIVDSWQNCWSEISLGPDCIALWLWRCFRGTVVGSLGVCSDYRLLVWVTDRNWYPFPGSLVWLIFQDDSGVGPVNLRSGCCQCGSDLVTYLRMRSALGMVVVCSL